VHGAGTDGDGAPYSFFIKLSIMTVSIDVSCSRVSGPLTSSLFLGLRTPLVNKMTKSTEISVATPSPTFRRSYESSGSLLTIPDSITRGRPHDPYCLSALCLPGVVGIHHGPRPVYRLERMVGRLRRGGYLPESAPSFAKMASKADESLFRAIIAYLTRVMLLL